MAGAILFGILSCSTAYKRSDWFSKQVAADIDQSESVLDGNTAEALRHLANTRYIGGPMGTRVTKEN